MTTTPLRTPHTTDHLDLLESPRHLHPARGRRRVRATGPALLGRQGLGRAVAPRGQGVRAPATALPGDAHRHRPELPRGPRLSRRARSARLGARLVVAEVQDSIDQGKVVDPGPMGSRNRLQTVTLLDAITEQRLRRRLRRRATRRGQGARQGAHPLVSRRLRPVGPAPAAPRALAALPGQGQPRRAPARLPAVGLDRARRLAVHRARADGRCPTIYFAHERDVVMRDGMWLAVGPVRRAARGRDGRAPHRALSHRRRRQLHRRGRSRRAPPWPRSSTRSRSPTSRSAARRAPTTSSARPPWRTASARGTSR